MNALANFAVCSLCVAGGGWIEIAYRGGWTSIECATVALIVSVIAASVLSALQRAEAA